LLRKCGNSFAMVVMLILLGNTLQAHTNIPTLYRKFLVASDTPQLPFPIAPTYDASSPSYNIIDLTFPDDVVTEVTYDPVSGMYIFTAKLNGMDYLPPSAMTFQEYIEYQNKQSIKNYYQSQVDEQVDDAREKEVKAPEGHDLSQIKFNTPLDLPIEIRTQGSAELKFGINISRTDNPVLPERQRRITTFDFNQQIQIGLTGKIGDLMNIGFNYNTEATFDFENKLKLNYSGKEDDILQLLEAGNVSMPLNSSLIQGSQSLFGIKSQLRFGRLTVTTVLSQDRGQKKEIEVSGGAQVQEFSIVADNYEENRHFFINYYFRENYDNAMATLPIPSSKVQIQRMEVWVTNRTNNFNDTRNILAFTDLGETKSINLENPGFAQTGQPDIPSNGHNALYGLISQNSTIRNYVNAANVLSGQFGMVQSIDYEKLENARLLNPNEYSYNSILGFISLNQSLNNDEVLGVAYQYTFNGETYQVGEFSTDGIAGQNALYVKMLKSTVRNPLKKLWDLMMKNVYSLGAYQIDQTNFRLDVWYNNPSSGIDINYIPKPGVDDKLLIQLLGLDRLNLQQQLFADGVFDFIPINATSGRIAEVGTINPRNGRLYFNTIEPFGKTLDDKLMQAGLPANVRKTVVFPQLYDSTKIAAQQIPELNRFRIKGTYQSSVSSEIALNAMNIPQGSVQVTAGGRLLTEGVDYTVDYNLGRVKILNDGILSSGTPIKIAMESNSLFSIQTKSLIGTNLDYKFNKDAHIGGTIMRLGERPLTQKVNIGSEPVSNVMLGLNGGIKKELPFLTKMVDMIPGINTKEKSYINFSGEVAALLPGHNKVIGNEGNAFIDDFEGSQSAIDIRAFNTWVMASVPQGQPDLFPEGELYDNLDYGKKRAKIAWYVIDPLFHNDNNLTPGYIRGSAMQQNNMMRQVLVREVFPNRELPTGSLNNIPVFDIAYYPSERGPYNYDTQNINFTDGKFSDPQNRWAGIMRPLTTNDFEMANIEYIQFWMMDPFANSDNINPNTDALNTTGGELYFNLGNISEDILRDGRKSFENGIPANGVYDPQTLTTTAWGWVPTTQVIVPAFDNDVTTRLNQDVGFDGLRNDLEANFFANYVNSLNVAPEVKARILADPSSDNYHYFRGDDYDAIQNTILERYKDYNNPEGNSPTSEYSATLNAQGYPTSATTLPNLEDINADNNLNESEAYFQYKIDLKPQNMTVGQNYIVDKILGQDERSGKTVYWYQFRIPIREFTSRVNGIQDFRSIRFIRMFLKGWSQEVVLRFARLELLRGEWRAYFGSLLMNGEYIQGEESNTFFNVGAVNIEDNGKRVPINYVVPPGAIREINFQTANLAQRNEQSLVLDVCGLKDGDARAAFRNVNFDVRNYNKIQMYVHAESKLDDILPMTGEVTVFVRLGTDFTNNYYEYEMPVVFSPWDVNTPESIWPTENDFVIDLQMLRAVKQLRNRIGFNIFERFTVTDSTTTDGISNSNRNVTVVGNPNLQALKTIMIGVRNPKRDDPNNQWQPDDGTDKCVQIWVNELRMTDFNNRPGWATIGRMTAQLADFADVSLAGNYSSPGWGSIEKSVSQRQQEHMYGFDASTTVRLEKFFGPRLGLKAPMYLGYTRNVIRPLYDPLNPDLILERGGLEDDQWREYFNNSIDLTERRAINFTNVSLSPTKKDGSKPKPRFYSISNFGVNFSYNEINKRDINTRYNDMRNYLAGFNYSYSKTPKPWEPFKNNKVIKKSKWLKPVKEFNLFFAPKQLGFNSVINRNYTEFATRYNFPGGENLEFPQYNKLFNWDRNYTVKYDLTKNLGFDFQAKNRAFVDEPFGKVDYGAFGYESVSARDTVLSSLQGFGRTMNYGHTIAGNYKWPLASFPLTDWMTLTTRYSASFDWTQQPLLLPDNTVGNMVQNSRELSWNGRMTMKTLYSKSKYLKKIYDKYNAPMGKTTSLSGGKVPPKPPVNPKDTTDKKGKKEDDPNKFKFFEQVVRVAMSLDNVTLTYSTTDGIMMPGYAPRTEMMGLYGNPLTAPWEFVAGGHQETDIFGRPTGRIFGYDAYANGWLIPGDSLGNIVSQYMVNHMERFNGKATLKPFTGFKIDVNADYSFTQNTNSIMGYNNVDEMFELRNPQFTGMYSRTIIAWPSAFARDKGDTNALNNITFTNMLEMRNEVSQYIGGQNGSINLNPNEYNAENGYATGYGSTQQDVLIGSFIAAYTGTEVSDKVINPFRKAPLPNWRITYDGFTKIPYLKKFTSKYFKNLAFTHSYKSMLNVAGFTTNLDYREGANVSDLNGNIISQRQILMVSIMEQFAPLLGVDMTLKNDMMAKVEYKKDRNIALSLANNQITEIKGTEFVLGTGYKWKKLQLPIKFDGKPLAPSDLDIRLDVNVRDNKTIIRKIVEEQNQPTAGNRIVRINFTANYALSKNLMVRLYFDRVVNKPFISTSFPTANTQAGFAIRFTL